jgi:hypothetical protein
MFHHSGIDTPIFFSFLHTLISQFVLFHSDQAEARRQKVKEAKKRREERIQMKRQELLASYAREDEKAAQKK